MSKYDKLLKKLLSNSKTFRFDELKNLLERLGYEIDNKGKTSGSRVSFKKEGDTIRLHKPHGREDVLHSYQIKQIITHLREKNLID